MPRTRRLLREELTYSDAKEREVNVLHQLGYYEQQRNFFAHLNGKRRWIKAVVAHHLGLKSPDACHVAEMKDWFHGSFNVCIPVTIDNWIGRQQPGKRVLLRFPLPYRVGEAFRPGNGDEKIRCEVGTYAWLQENCPDVPIPQLYGFAMSTGETVWDQVLPIARARISTNGFVQFTRLDNLPLISRCFQLVRRILLSWLGRPVPSRYVRHQGGSQILHDSVASAGYLLIECIEQTQGTMLSNTWSDKRHDIKLRTNLFRDLSRIMLSISRIPLPRIGSFVIDNDGFLRLTNRPLSIEIQALENERIPTDILHTYSTVESYVVDMLALHDSRFRNQPNAVNNLGDCVYQLSALTAMRAVFPCFFQRNFRRGPFVFILTDLHQSNIFVDDDWHITCLVDLEWACSRPIEMVRTPYWFTDKGVDEIIEEEYNAVRTEFMDILASEERKGSSCCCATSKGDSDGAAVMPKLSDVMKQTWETGTFWYTLALSTPTGLFRLFYEHIQPLFSKDYPEEFSVVMPFYWEKKVGIITGRKLQDKERYDIQLRQAFEDSPPAV